MLSFRLYVSSSSDFARGEFRAAITDMLDDFKLEKQLETRNRDVKIHHTTDLIPGIKKAKAAKMLKEILSKNNKNQYDRRHHTDITVLVEIIDAIASTCIKEYEIKNEKAVAEKRRVELEIKKQKEKDALQKVRMDMESRRYQRFDIVSSDEEPDEDDEDFVVDEDAELSVDTSESDEDTDKSESGDESENSDEN